MSAEAAPAPSVSVIVPTYQRRDAVGCAVASVFAQTFRDFELIVVDDGSEDGTGEALAALGGRIRYVWQPNAGVAAARNTGLRMARGRIVAFLDSDDRWLPDHLAVVTEVLARRPEAILVSTCPRFHLGGREHAREAKMLDLRERLIEYGDTVGFGACIAVRSEALARSGPFDERIRAGEDTDLWTRLGALGPVATVRRRTVVCARNDGSLRERARRAGDYLAGAEMAADNLVALVERLPPSEQVPLRGQATGAVHLARAMSALDHGDLTAVAAELERARGLEALSGARLPVAFRIRGHLRRGHDPRERVRALSVMADLWPDQRADTARHLRLLALVAAVRLGRPMEVAALGARWRWRGSLGFARRIAPTLVRRLRRILQERHPS